MKTFFNAKDLGDIKGALAEAQLVKKDRNGIPLNEPQYYIYIILHLFLDKVMTKNRTVTLSRCHALQSQSVKNANAHFALFVPFECLRDFFCRKYLFATC